MYLDFGFISLEGACGFPCPHSFVFFYRSEMRQGNGDKGMKGDGGVTVGWRWGKIGVGLQRRCCGIGIPRAWGAEEKGGDS